MSWTLRVKRGAELSSDHHLVVSWLRWQRRKLDRPGRPKRIVRVCWERLAEPCVREVFNSHLRKSFSQIPREAGDIESEWTMFSASIVDAGSVRSCGRKVSGACRGGNPPNPVVDTGSKDAVRLKKESYRTMLACGTPGAVDRYQAGQASQPGRSWRQKLRSGRSSVRPWRRTIIGRPRRDSGKPSGASEGGGKQYSANTVYSAGGELLTSTEDMGHCRTVEEILRGSPQSHRPCLPVRKQEAGDSEVDPSITQAEVTEVVSQAPRWQGAGGWMRSALSTSRCLRVYGSLPNQSTCALWIWRRHSTVSLVVFCGEVLHEYGVRGPLLRAVRSLYDHWSRSLVRIAFRNVVRFLGIVARGRRESRFGNHRISSLLFADDVVLLASSSQDLQHVLERFAAKCEAAGMRISTSKSEAMVLDQKRVACPLRVSGEVLPQVEEFKYLGFLVHE
ncbi:hypothetical protein L3Q82_022426 [Scortum barcoo]|uniref:Uncharacterized protein n=1 Tax=Scortum barcoo TaxID=214431 RepID=A0ACB8X1K2_9TELE|nr:hypothetical protein L3Q82_022426 [Scortum barcoo]